jgi:hypothetical protein
LGILGERKAALRWKLGKAGEWLVFDDGYRVLKVKFRKEVRI